ncbi:hypothetical protein HY642_01735 [Candidatus Woesearchaeota archaeon]|nr:hypothetical protein [Candidatus Woesearchaeota archaeon]
MIEELQELGLSRREAQAYVALLELGSSKVGNIVKQTGIPSSKIYEILDRLVKRGFASYVLRGSVKHYQAAEPKTLLAYMDERRKKVQDVLPQLLLKQKFATRQSVELFEGQKALFTLLTGLIEDAKPREQYLVFSIGEESKTEDAKLFFKNIAVRRKEKKLDVFVLKNNREYVKEEHTKVKLRYTRFDLPQGITVFRDTVVLVSWMHSPTAIRIESDAFASQLRTFFMQLWKEAKE